MALKFQLSDTGLDDMRLSDGEHVVVAAFGYECRAKEFTAAYLAKNARPRFAAVDFSDLREGEGRLINDRFLHENGITPQKISSHDYQLFQEYVDSSVHQARGEERTRVTVYLDYSCMPRAWYCNLSAHLLSTLIPGDVLELWYTPGKYNEKAFSPSGIDDFEVFSGQASLSPSARTHILGLGFESVRAHAILAVIDPEYLVCFYADPGVSDEYVQRALDENRDLLNAAQQNIKLPLPSFDVTFTRLRGITQEFRSVGDVILIPDGPKPLVLAASLVPITIDQPGVTCLHVRRRARKPQAALDVRPAGPPYGARLIVEGSVSG